MAASKPPCRYPRLLSAMVFALSLALVLAAYAYRNVSGLLLALTLLFGGLAWRSAPLRTSLTFLASLFLALTVAESSAPFLYRKPAYPYKLLSPVDYWVVTDIGAIGSEGIHHFKLIAPGDRVIYDTDYTIGEDGFRVTPPAASTGDRINFFGDSFTFGEGLGDRETLPYYLAELTGRPVKNYGFQGYGVQQPLAILDSELDTSGAINFLLTIPWQAQRAACKVNYSAGSPKYEIAADGELVETGQCRMITGWGPLGKIIDRSKLYDLYLDTRSTEVTDADYDRYLAIIGEMARVSRERGQKFIVGFIRSDESLFKGTHFSNELLLERLRALADEVVDLTLAPRNEDLDRKYYIDEIDKHPSALANQERAKILKDVFERQSK